MVAGGRCECKTRVASTEQLSALAAGSSSTENLPSVDSDAAAARDTITKQQQQQQKSRPDALEVT